MTIDELVEYIDGLLEGDSSKADAVRPSAAKRGYGHKWRKRRAEFLAANPKCKCGAIATHVHHSHRKRKGGVDSPSNLRARCSTCHSIETNKRDKRQ